MPVVLSPEHGGWVRVSPPKRHASPQKQAEALRSGALSYFACTPSGPSRSTSKLPPCPKYDIDASPQSPRKKKSRVVSAPPITADDEDDDDGDYYSEHEGDRISRRPREDKGRRTVSSAAPRGLPASRRAEAAAGQGQSKYWTGPSNRNRTSPSASRNQGSYARSTVSSSWASATQPLNL